MDNNEHSTNLAEVGTGCISKQQAIDAVRATLLAWSYMPEWRDNKIIEAVKRLPPIQPEIVRCEDCKYHHKRICPIERYFSLDGFCSRGEKREVTT